MRGADCDIVNFLVVAKVREILAVYMRAAQNFHVERFNFEKLDELEVRKQKEIKISNSFVLWKN